MDCNDGWLIFCLRAVTGAALGSLAASLVLLGAEAGGRGDALFG